MDGSTASRGSSLSAPGLPKLPLPVDSDEQPRLVNSETVVRNGSLDTSGYIPHVEATDGSILAKLFPPTLDADSISTLSANGIELAQFKIEERIGLGGMGAVFRALDTTLQRHVALKLLSPSQSFDSSSVKRFRNEARAAARLNHENISTVHFIGEDKGLHFIAFEFVTGSNIRDLIRRRGKMPIADTVNYVLQIAYALKHISAMGVVHRDIKPSNIIITPKGRAKLVDLGLARNETTESQGELTLPGTTLGTFDYISPEQAKDPRSVDVRSDIYSLGCTLFHMLTGQAPYPEGTVLQKLLEHQASEVPDPRTLNPAVSEQLSLIVQRMMNSDRNKRYQTPDQLIRDLTYVAGRFGLKGVNPEGLVWIASRAARPRNYAALTGWVATLGILLGVVGILHQFPQISQNLTGVTEPGSNPGTAGTSEGTAKAGNAEVAAAEAPLEAESPAISSPPDPATGRIETPIPISVATPDPGSESGTESTTGAAAPAGSEAVTGPVEPPATEPEVKPVEPPEVGVRTETVAGTEKPATGPSESEAGTTEPVAVVPQEDFEPFVVLGADLTFDRRCRTLNAACLAVENGGVIRLAFSGIRDKEKPDKPVRITRKNITIMAEGDHTPVINFVASDVDSTPDGQMISVLGGRVSIVGVQFQMSIPETASGQQYSLFGVSNPARLELSRVAGTITNPRRVKASFVSGILDSSKMPSDMPMPAGSPQTMDVEATDCLFRGGGSFAQVAFKTPAQFTLTNSAFALQDDLLRIDAGSQSMQRTRLGLTLKHVTAAFDSSLVRFEGFAGQEVNSTVYCLSRNSIHSFTGSSQRSALILAEGAVSSEDARKMLAWEGDRNFYNQLDRFWFMEGSQDSLTFDDWLSVWGPTQEVGAANGPIPWAVPEWTLAVALREVTAAEFALDPEASGLAATDGSSAGCDVSRLPAFYKAPPAISPLPPVELDSGDADNQDADNQDADDQAADEVRS
ncbi:MAG: protein kinase [Planctomycetota bacterium]|nr:protein kinase [Planctomycetota bacterium]MDA1248226.1 protein kinase [Planctomycetota bacterium]